MTSSENACTAESEPGASSVSSPNQTHINDVTDDTTITSSNYSGDVIRNAADDVTDEPPPSYEVASASRYGFSNPRVTQNNPNFPVDSSTGNVPTTSSGQGQNPPLCSPPEYPGPPLNGIGGYPKYTFPIPEYQNVLYTYTYPPDSNGANDVARMQAMVRKFYTLNISENQILLKLFGNRLCYETADNIIEETNQRETIFLFL